MPRTSFIAPACRICPGVIPAFFGHSYTITADVTLPEQNAEGVIVAEASFLGGFALWVGRRQAEAHLQLLRS